MMTGVFQRFLQSIASLQKSLIIKEEGFPSILIRVLHNVLEKQKNKLIRLILN